MVIIDLETSGFSHNKDRIIEVAVGLVKGHSIVDIFHTKINPSLKINVEIQELTGLTNDELSMAPSFKEIEEKLYEFCFNHVIVGYNVAFDKRFLNAASRRFGNLSYYDYMKYVKQNYKDLDSYKMRNVAREFGVNFEKTHSALTDIKILHAIMVRAGWPDLREEYDD